MLKKFHAAALAALLPTFALAAQDGENSLVGRPFSHTIKECWEGSQFIMHAAQARDNGYSSAKFKMQLEADFKTLRQLPMASRWFIYTPDDEKFVRAWVNEAYDKKRNPDELAQEFLARCQGYNGVMPKMPQLGEPNPF